MVEKTHNEHEIMKQTMKFVYGNRNTENKSYREWINETKKFMQGME